MSNLVFMLPFGVGTSAPWANTLKNRLELTPTRVDDWDLQMGFRLVGDTGAIRLFKRTTVGQGANPEYALFGTAVTPEDRDQVTTLYPTCLEAVRSIDAQIDRDRLIDPQRTEQLQREGEF
jgi:hypothetical protein